MTDVVIYQMEDAEQLEFIKSQSPRPGNLQVILPFAELSLHL